LLLDRAEEIKTDIKKWLASKGVIIKFIGGKLVDPIWALVTGPLLPVIVGITIDIIFGASAPILTPFIPAIVQIIRLISDDIVSEDDKQSIEDLLEAVRSYNASHGVLEAIQLSPQELVNFRNTQEYF
jgi:hypothetical protein